jgi:PEP-CTERM motif
MNEHLRRRFIALFAVVAAAFFAGLAATARAQTVGYDLDVSENLQVLNNQGNNMISMHAAWTTPAQLAMERKMPYLALTNTSTVANGGTGSAELTSFTLDISGSSQDFRWVKLVPQYTSPGVTTTIVTPANNVHSNQVVLDFNGLTPGKKVEFRVDLIPDSPSGNLFPDYRDVFFKLNGGNNPAGNAQTSASFFDPSIPDTITTDPIFWDNQIDDKPTSMGLQFHAQYMGDHVTSFQTGNVSTTVPEPATIVLGGLGALGLALLARRRRM